MGWFKDQIKTRELNDKELISDAFAEIAGAVLGKRLSAALSSDRIKVKVELDRILKYYNIKPSEIPEELTDINDQIDYLMHPNGIMRRNIKLAKHWYKDAIGALLGVRKDNSQIVALLPSSMGGYHFFDENGNKKKLSSRNETLFEIEAICFYRPFPPRALNVADLIKYIGSCVSTSDIAFFGASTLAVTLLGLFMPRLNQIIFSDLIASGTMRTVVTMLSFLCCVSISTVMMSTVKALVMTRLNAKISLAVEAAVMSRILSLHPSFFKEYSSGDLSLRANYVQSFCNELISSVLSVGLGATLSLIYIAQIFHYAKPLVLPALCIIAVTVGFSTASASAQMRVSKKLMELNSELNGLEYALIAGVQKLKLTGSENRAFAKWGKQFSESAMLTNYPPSIIKLNAVYSTAIMLAGSALMQYLAVRHAVGVADYYAFNTAYSMISAAFTSLAGIMISVAKLKSMYEMVNPILSAVPEASNSKNMVTSLSGNIEINNVSFRYKEDMPNVIDGLSLKIKAGQYVAIVGSTGCGKSTLMRLLLGFEKPQKGAIYFDGKDISKINLRSQRSCIGVVLQDGKLFSGDIYSNITVSMSNPNIEDAWRAAEIAGIAEDIRKMPMGMHTHVSEGSGGISGGQKQRLMIARAVATHPKILMLDEATSALDNITQQQVSDALAALKCTRLVIAHRLSTIKQCDRIMMLDKGKIIEDGTYDELLALNGAFAELVERQRIEK